RRAHESLSASAVGRPGAARRHRARDRHRSDAPALRRADGRPRSPRRRRDPRPAPGAQPRSRQDDRDGDARSGAGGPGEGAAPSRQRRPRDAGGGCRMKFLPIVARNLLRRKFRTFFTMGAIFFAFMLFGVLMAIKSAFGMGIEMAGESRLMVIDKV